MSDIDTVIRDAKQIAADVRASFGGLSAAQLNWKPSAERWSIAQCFDHLLAVNHGGDSDSTGAICGNLLGTLHGETALPPVWLVELEGRDTILQLADDFSMEMTQGAALHGPGGSSPGWLARYPRA